MKTGKTIYHFETIVKAPLPDVKNILFDISSGHYEKNLSILLSEMGTVDIIQKNQNFMVRQPDSGQEIENPY